MRRPYLILFFLVFVAAGCATASGSSGDEPRRDRNLITREEIEALPTLTGYQIVQRLRPAWLRSRGPVGGGSGYARVFQDGMEMGDLGSLRNITSESIQRLRYIPATDATTRFGTGYTGGIIEIITRG